MRRILILPLLVHILLLLPLLLRFLLLLLLLSLKLTVFKLEAKLFVHLSNSADFLWRFQCKAAWEAPFSPLRHNCGSSTCSGRKHRRLEVFGGEVERMCEEEEVEKGGEGGGMCEEEEVERGRRRGNVWGGRDRKGEKEGECVRRKSIKGEKEGECVRRKSIKGE
jgi:hypothetical protein